MSLEKDWCHFSNRHKKSDTSELTLTTMLYFSMILSTLLVLIWSKNRLKFRGGFFYPPDGDTTVQVSLVQDDWLGQDSRP